MLAPLTSFPSHTIDFAPSKSPISCGRPTGPIRLTHSSALPCDEILDSVVTKPQGPCPGVSCLAPYGAGWIDGLDAFQVHFDDLDG